MLFKSIVKVACLNKKNNKTRHESLSTGFTYWMTSSFPWPLNTQGPNFHCFDSSDPIFTFNFQEAFFFGQFSLFFVVTPSLLLAKSRWSWRQCVIVVTMIVTTNAVQREALEVIRDASFWNWTTLFGFVAQLRWLFPHLKVTDSVKIITHFGGVCSRKDGKIVT